MPLPGDTFNEKGTSWRFDGLNPRGKGTNRSFRGSSADRFFGYGRWRGESTGSLETQVPNIIVT